MRVIGETVMTLRFLDYSWIVSAAQMYRGEGGKHDL